MDVYPANVANNHPTKEMEMEIEMEARKASLTPDAKTLPERTWGIAARVAPDVTFEEYRFWAKLEREMEEEEERRFRAEHGKFPLIELIKGKFSSEGRARQKREKEERAMAIQSSMEAHPQTQGDSKTGAEVASQESSYQDPLKPTDAEWRQAARALKTASWGQMFFLITTDILGWSGAP